MKQALPDFNLFYDSPAEAEKIEAYARAGALGMLKARVVWNDAVIIKAGSRFEMNGDLYTLEEDKTLSVPAGDEWTRYIYFDGLGFSITSTAPSFKAGGWYDGDNRALIKVRAQFGCIFWSLLDRQFYSEVKVKDATQQTVFGSSTVGGHIFTVPVDGRYKFGLTGGGGGASGSGGGGSGGYLTGPSSSAPGMPGGGTEKGGDGGNFGGAGAPAIAGSAPSGGTGGKGADGRGGGAGKKFTGEAALKKGDVVFVKIGRGGKGGAPGLGGRATSPGTQGTDGKAGENGEDTTVSGAFWGTASGGSAGSGKTGGGSGSGKGGNGANGGAGGVYEGIGGSNGTKGGDGTGGSCTITIIK